MGIQDFQLYDCISLVQFLLRNNKCGNLPLHITIANTRVSKLNKTHSDNGRCYKFNNEVMGLRMGKCRSGLHIRLVKEGLLK